MFLSYHLYLINCYNLVFLVIFKFQPTSFTVNKSLFFTSNCGVEKLRLSQSQYYLRKEEFTYLIQLLIVKLLLYIEVYVQRGSQNIGEDDLLNTV